MQTTLNKPLKIVPATKSVASTGLANARRLSGRYGHVKMKNFIFAFLLSVPGVAFSWEETLIHQHYTKWSGVLPKPYGTIEVEISLNPDNDDLRHFAATIGGNTVSLTPDQLGQLKDLELGTLRMAHEIYGEEDGENYFMDWVHIYIEQGEMHRIQLEESGKAEYRWGRNQAVITIIYGKKACVSIREFGKQVASIADCELDDKKQP